MGGQGRVRRNFAQGLEEELGDFHVRKCSQILSFPVVILFLIPENDYIGLMRQKILVFLLFPVTLFAAAALSNGVSGTGTLESAVPLPYKTLQADASFSYYPGAYLGIKGGEGGADRFDLAASVNYGLFSFLEIGLYAPYFRDMDTKGNDYKGLGDIRTSLKLNYPPYPHPKGLEISLLAQMDWPTATSAGRSGGFTRHSYYGISSTDDPPQTRNAFGAYGPTLITRMLMTANLGEVRGFIPLMIHLNWGAAFTGANSQNAFLLGGGAEFKASSIVTLFWSFQSEVPITQADKSIPLFSYPFGSSAGLQLQIPKVHMEVYSGVHFDLNDQKDITYTPGMDAASGTPQYSRYPGLGVFLGVGGSFSFLPRDTDGDGILGEKDLCPDQPEDQDGFQDEDGCPDVDNDLDKIPDSRDKCPLQAEDRDNFQDEDGCPEPDNDGDGIPDEKDKCPGQSEDKDNYQDEDGCPDLDNDGDKINDDVDRCPFKQEDHDSFEDEDGCPDVDNDRDGIPDHLDRCPLQAEVVNGVDDGDGCPDAAPTYEELKEKALQENQ